MRCSCGILWGRSTKNAGAWDVIRRKNLGSYLRGEKQHWQVPEAMAMTSA